MARSPILVETGPDQGAIWHFGEVANEQRALAEGRAWAELSQRAIISVTGPDRLVYLHAITTQHLESLQPGIWQEALILDAQGHISYQFFLVDDGSTTFLQVDFDRAESLLTYLGKMKFMMQVEISDVSSNYAILRTPGKTDQIGGPYALIPRGDLLETKEAFDSTNLQVGMWALEAERVAQGRIRIGLDTDYKTIPNELGILNAAVHMKKGCYPGQETVAKVFILGQPPRRLVLLHLDGSAVDIPTPGTSVLNGDKEIGFMGTVARHYELGTIALALIKRSTPIENVLTVMGIAASQETLVPMESLR